MKIFQTLLLCLFLTFFCEDVLAQGCVAIRGLTCGANLGGNVNLSRGEWMSQTGFRYFKSFRHFRGSHEETERVEEGTEVINHSFFLDLSLNYGITDRLYANAVIPFVYHNRSSMYEHGGNPPNGLGERHETSSQGLADVRLGLGYWLFAPSTDRSFNYAVGLGVKLPTGKYDYKDTFYNQGDNRDVDRQAVVDQSIQPGDGGTGIAVDIQGFQALSPSLVLSTNLYYLINYQETNGVLTRNGRSEFSCPDQFAVRLGAYYITSVHGLSAYLGGRAEGVPAKDLVGGSAGYRRPGYVLSIEPGFNFGRNNYAFNVGLPFALVRNRTQSYEDKQRTKETGEHIQGDAAFANFLLNLTFTYRFGGGGATPEIILSE